MELKSDWLARWLSVGVCLWVVTWSQLGLLVGYGALTNSGLFINGASGCAGMFFFLCFCNTGASVSAERGVHPPGSPDGSAVQAPCLVEKTFSLNAFICTRLCCSPGIAAKLAAPVWGWSCLSVGSLEWSMVACPEGRSRRPGPTCFWLLPPPLVLKKRKKKKREISQQLDEFVIISYLAQIFSWSL